MYLKTLIRESLFYVNLEDWDRNTPSNSPKALGTKSKFGKERVHREVLSQSVHLMSVVLARQNSRTKNDAPRKAAWSLAKNIYKLKNADKAAFYIPIEARVMPITSKETRRTRIRSRFRSINAHDEQERIELRRIMGSKNFQNPNRSVDCKRGKYRSACISTHFTGFRFGTSYESGIKIQEAQY